MTASEIIKELNHLPSLVYIYWNTIDNKEHTVILGGQSCPKNDEHTGIITARNHNTNMQRIFEKDVLEESDKYTLVKEFKHIRNICDYRDSGLYTLSQQEEYLSELKEESLEEIAKQIEMYKLARSLYRNYK